MDKESEKEKLRQLFKNHRQKVFGFFRSRGYSRDDCLDLTQETFLEAVKGIRRFRNDVPMEAWLIAVMRNVWKRALRDRARYKRKGVEVSLEATIDIHEEMSPFSFHSGDGKGPLLEVLGEEKLEVVRKAIHELPETMRICTLLRIDQGLKDREIAQAMRMSPDAVKNQLLRARRKLRDRLAPYFDDKDSER